MSSQTVEHLDVFWELIDEILNAVLFVLLGMEILAISFTRLGLFAGLWAIPVVLAARFFSVWLPVTVLRRRRRIDRLTVRMLTWGGLRGAIAVALALVLPRDLDGREIILMMTYVVVVFSVLVQGLTIGPLTRYWLNIPKSGSAAPN
jgi:CPA1 family monovalent cation:H+ antiporter